MRKTRTIPNFLLILLCCAFAFGAAILINGTRSNNQGLIFSTMDTSMKDSSAKEADAEETTDEDGSKEDASGKKRHKESKEFSTSLAENPSVSSSDNTSTEIESYADDNIEITINEVSGDNLTYYIADIQVSSAEYLKTAFAYGQYGSNYRQYTSTMANNNQALLAISGDYYNHRTDGIIIRNGILYRDEASDRQMLIIDENGDFSFAWETDVEANALVEENVLQTFSFGPALVIDGSVQEIPSDYFIDTETTEPRCAIGQISELHYVFVVVDGRDDGYSIGVTIAELAEIMGGLGCVDAYNLDGGGSATLVFNGELVNSPSNGGSGGEREISDIIYVR